MNKVKYETFGYNYRKYSNHTFASLLPLLLIVQVRFLESSHDVNVTSRDG